MSMSSHLPLPSTRATLRRWGVVVALAALGALLIVAMILLHDWPYRHAKVKPLLDNTLAGDVTMQSYRRLYFPNPGFQATGLVLRRRSNDPSLPPLGTANRVIVEGRWIDLLLLRHHVQSVDIEGLHLAIPAPGTRQRAEDFPPGSSGDFSGPSTTIGKLVFRDALLEVGTRDGDPIRFPVAKLLLHNVQRGDPLRYTLDMTNPTPAGHILAQGSFGPIDTHNLGATPVSGDFQFVDVQLATIGSLHGRLKAEGHFDNTLASIAAQAETSTPDFSVGAGRPIAVRTRIRCTVNGLNGDVHLDSVDAMMGSTPVHLHGAVSGDPKRTHVDLDVKRGRAQDLLRPFDQTSPPITGPVALRTTAEILPRKGKEDFLSRLVMNGAFTLPEDRLSNRSTEQKLSSFSERASGDKQGDAPDPEADALSSLTATVTVRNGLVTAERLHFAVPGAAADLNGTYSFRNKGVHMTGKLSMDTDLSHVTTGFKSALLKPFAPFFKHGSKGAVVPIAVTGGPGTYRVSGNFLHTK